MIFYLKYKIIILRVFGVILLLTSILMQFWDNSKTLIDENDRAAIRVARMEASVKGNIKKETSEPDTSKFVKNIKDSKSKQQQYITIFSFVFGTLFLGYSFIRKKEDG